MPPIAEKIENKEKVMRLSQVDAIHALQSELEKGIGSVEKGEIYTLEEAWEKIDKI